MIDKKSLSIIFLHPISRNIVCNVCVILMFFIHVVAAIAMPSTIPCPHANSSDIFAPLDRQTTDTMAESTDIFQVKELTLSNGLTVWINEDHTQPKAYGAVVVKAGARDCPNTGIAHYFEHILFKGTDKIGTVDYAGERPWLDSIAACYDRLSQTVDENSRRVIQKDINRLSIKAAQYAIPNEFSNLISRYGGTGLNAYTSLDETVFYNTFSPQYIAQWAELNSERMLHPVFRLFQGELETVYEEKNMYSDNMFMQALEAVQRRVFAGTPYEYPVIGSTESLKNPRLSEMQDFFDRYYVAGNMGLILCGDICSDTIVPLLERTFGRLRRGDAPRHTPITQRPFGVSDRLDIKVPIPIIKAQGYLFRAPKPTHPDYVPLELAMSLLSNESGTGLLDSLEHAHKVMGVMAGVVGLTGDEDLIGYGYVPRLPFGSKRKADRMTRRQIERLVSGDFDDAILEALKIEEQRKAKEALEDMSMRSSMMVNAFSRNRQWADVLSRPRQVQTVTHADIQRVARQYLGGGSLQVTKRFGSYAKDKVSQPGYTPVSPANTGVHSEYAKHLEQMPIMAAKPRFVDFNNDVHTIALRPLVKLYTVDNPVNDIFTLELIYHRGTIADRRLEAVASYISNLGTDSLSPHQFGCALQRLGSEISVAADKSTFTVTVKGFDRYLGETMQLLSTFFSTIKADDDKFDELVTSERIFERTFFRDNTTIADALFERVAYGEKSTFLNRTTSDMLKQMNGRQLVDIFRDLQHSELSIVYSGTLPADCVENNVSRWLPIDIVSRPHTDSHRTLLSYDEPVIYIFDNPSARQTIIGTYQQLPAQPSVTTRARLNLWGRYFGRGMSSLMFQDIREFRSLAYYAYGEIGCPSLIHHPDAPVAYQTVMGTQSDKAMQALGILDTLFTAMPMRENNVIATKETMRHSVNNNRPTFRAIGRHVAELRSAGYDDDPARASMAALEPLGPADVLAFYDVFVRPAKRVTVVVGDRRKLDLDALSRYGRVVELKKKDVFRTGR